MEENHNIMDNICGSKFWDSNLTWMYTNDPDLTSCFQTSILIWLPCIYLWMFTFVEVKYLVKSTNKNTSWTWHLMIKYLLTISLILLSLCDLIMTIYHSFHNTVYPIQYYTPIIKTTTFILAGILLFFNQKMGMRTSGVLFLFWFLLALFGAIQFRSEIKNSINKNETIDFFVPYMIYYPIVIVMFLLQFKAEGPPKYSEYIELEKLCPEKAASFPSKIFFTWLDKLIWKGYVKPLEIKNLWSLNPELSASKIKEKFNTNHKTTRSSSPSENESNQSSYNLIKQKVNCFVPLYKSFGSTFIFATFLKVIADVMILINPKILELLIGFISMPEQMWKGILYTVLILSNGTIGILISSQFSNKMSITGLKIRTALITAIYKKSLLLTNGTKYTVGEITTLITVDVQKIMDSTQNLSSVISIPLQIIISIYLLWNILGVALFSGIIGMIIMTPLNGIIIKKLVSLQTKQMQVKGERVKLINEVLNGIRVLKLYAWELSFKKKIMNIRNKEINILRKFSYILACNSFIFDNLPVIIPLASFVTYIYIDDNNVLDSSKIFVSISLFNILREALVSIPLIIGSLVQTIVSIKRINEFINQEELDLTIVQHENHNNDESNVVLMIENGTFSWNDNPTLNNINLKIYNGQLIAIVGTIGSGKSSLISAFLGQMKKINGNVYCNGTRSYVTQQAWIQNTTIKNNILFGKVMNVELYNKVIKACALDMDLKILPAGDDTEIGEKGINLSGGQKQRVSLARAVYNNSDIYFFDDPLSAVDSHVSEHIFKFVIGPMGLLKNKTRIFVTHGIQYLPKVDEIKVLKNGEITETDGYTNLIQKKGAFSVFLNEHLTDVQKNNIKITNVMPESSMNDSINLGFIDDEESTSVPLENNTTCKLENNLQSKNKNTIIGQNIIDEEKVIVGNVGVKVYKEYVKSMGWILPIFFLIMIIIYQILNVSSNFWLKKWSEDVDVNKKNMYVFVYALLGFGQGLSIYLITIILFISTIRASKNLFQELLNNILKTPVSFFDTTPLGRILNRLVKDTDIVDNVLPVYIGFWLHLTFMVISSISVISYNTITFLIVIIPVFIIYYLILCFYISTSRQLTRLESITRSPIYSHFSETINGVNTIRAYNMEDSFIEKTNNLIDINSICYYPYVMSNTWLTVRLGIMGNILVFFAALFAVINRENISPGTMGLSLTYAFVITQNLSMLIQVTSSIESNIVAVERIKEYSDIPQEETLKKNQTTIVDDSWPSNGYIEFCNLSLRYRDGLDLVLKELSFVINGNEKIGIIGRTGSGKSSLTLALFRIIEAASGKILIDGIDISKLSLSKLRSKLTIIPQDPVLFGGSLRMNLDPFDIHEDEAIWTALERSHLKSFVTNLPDKLHYEISEGGDNLSTGQRQLICLARALLRKTKILILDEATAGVDFETDDLIQQTIKNEFSDCTIITIAHRLNTIIHSDRVMVLDKGSIVEFDCPDELLKNHTSLFYSMAKNNGLVG